MVDTPFAAFLRPTLSIALSRARPMRNSRDKSDNISECPCFISGSVSPTVDPLLICKGLTLLRLVPFDDETVSEGKSCTRVGGTGDW
jgi:hypothetical protein